MDLSTHTLVVHADEKVATALKARLDQEPGSESRLSGRRNLDGDAAAWIVVATIAGQALPHVLDFLKSCLSAKQVKKFKIGDIEIENPTPEDLEILRKEIQNRRE